jgi:hypothetical protein
VPILAQRLQGWVPLELGVDVLPHPLPILAVGCNDSFSVEGSRSFILLRSGAAHPRYRPLQHRREVREQAAA